MTFTTPTFLVFLTVVYAAYWRLGRRGQNLLLLAASLLFYGWWDWRFLFLLLLTAGIDYAAAIGLAGSEAPRRRRGLLLVSLATNLCTLGLFKYYDFFAASLQAGLAGLGIRAEPALLRLVLPVGISFYTFQALSYTVDVYRRQIPATRSVVDYLAFIVFFPQLVAGPIERASQLLPQFQRERRFDPDAAADGARQILWGFFKKMVVADALAVYVNEVYGGAADRSGAQLLWATYAFAFQIYGDFSGYTDIAIGCARLFDFRLMRNFDSPYLARDIPEFWRRWHISLSTWFRDYVYLPLGGSRLGRGRWIANILAVFLLSGLWHGADWTYVAWGLFHAVAYLAASRFRPAARGDGRRRSGLAEAAAVLFTFHLVCIGWVFFRAASLGDALLILQRIAGALAAFAVEPPARPAGLAWAGLLFVAEWLQRRRPHALDLAHWTPPLRWAAYYAVALALALFASLQYTPFIYFQF